MSSQFLRHRSRLAREAAVRNVEDTVQRLACLVLNATALADRMEARPARDLDGTRERTARVAALRKAARAGQEAIGRSTADLLRDESGRRREG